MSKTRIAPWIDDNTLDSMWKRLDGVSIINSYPWSYWPVYLIPYELVINPIETSAILFSKSEDGCVTSNQVQYINSQCNLSTQEYYDLVILKIKYVEDRPKCELNWCNEYVPWSGRISNGYGNGRYDKHFCCKEHQLSYKYSAYPDKGIASIKSKLLAKRNSFLSDKDFNRPAEFYIGTVNSKLKYGVTVIRDTRFTSKFHENDITFTNGKIMFESKKLVVANFEYLIGLELNQVTEYIEFNNTSKFRKAYNKYIDKLDILNTNDIDELNKLLLL